MHLSYVLAAVVTVLTTVSSFPHWHAGKRQLDGYGPGPVIDHSPSEFPTSKKHPKYTPHPPIATGTGHFSLTGFPTYTGSYPTGTAGASGTGTGSGSPTFTGVPPIFPNATSILPSDGGPIGGSTGLPPGSVPPTGSFPSGPIEGATVGTSGPIAPTACPPVPVITVTQSISFTVTITAPVIPPIGTAPLPSASFSSAPFPVPGNGTLSRGPTGTGTGLPGTGLPGTRLPGTGAPILPTFTVPAKSATLDSYYK